jgi:Ig-like domain CHU_C associated/Secretion system C-terminal sorting domain
MKCQLITLTQTKMIMFRKITLSIFMLFPLFAFSQEREEEGNSQLERANWEKLITSDPKTGLIPRNELEKSRVEMFRTIQKNKSSRVQSAIPNITWTERGPNNVGGRTRAMLWDPNDSTKRKVWVGGVAGGLWYNNNILDEKSSWQKVNDLWDNIAVGWITADPSNPKIMYVGTGERGSSGSTDNTGGSGSGGAGVWKTMDAGKTWKRLDSTIPDYTKLNNAASWREIYKIIVNAKGEVFVLNYGGLFRSKDGGTTWAAVAGTNAPSNDNFDRVSDMEIGSDGILYVAEGSGLFAAKILKSTNDSVNAFKDITPTGTFNKGRVEFALAPSTKGESQVIYAVSALSGVSKANFFLKSFDAGTTWTTMKVPVYDDLNGGGEKQFMGDQGTYDLILGTHETNPNALYAAGIAYSMSVDSGSTWLPKRGYAELGALMHVDNHAFVARPGFPDEAIFGNDGGVYYAPDWSSSGKNYPKIKSRNRGYNVTQYFSIDINNTANSGTIVVGSQDNGTHSLLSSNGTIGSGFEINGGDGGLTFIDKLDTNIVISSYTHVTPRLNMAGAVKNDSLAVEMQPQFDKRGAFINPADYDSPTHTLYENNTLASEELTKIFRYHIKGVSPKYTYKTSNLTFSGVKALSVSFLKLGKIAGNLYIGTNEGDVYKATGIPAEGDTTIALTKIMDKDSTSAGNVSCLDFGTDEKTMIVTKSNYNVKSVFYTINGGKTWISKDDSLHALPNIPIRYALINPKNTKQVLLATELGVWSMTDITDSTSKWEPNNTTLANVRCDMLKYRASDETVALATHGRGAFTTRINQPCASAVSDEKVTVCSGTTASLIATCATGQVKWFDSTGVKELFAGSPFITSKLTKDTVFKVRCVADKCPIVFTKVTVTIGTSLNPPTAADVTIKTGTSATLTATCASGTPNWYSTSSGGTSLGSVTFKTPILEANTTYYVACESSEQSGCVSSRTLQTVKIGTTGSVGGNSSEEIGKASVRLANENSEENLEVVVNVFPNPTTGLLNWKLQSKELTDVSLYLFNAIGKEQMTQTIPTISQTHEGTIDMSRFYSGFYLLKFKMGEKVITRKVVKN